MTRYLILLLALSAPLLATAQTCTRLVAPENAMLTQSVPGWGLYSYDLVRGNFSGAAQIDVLELYLVGSVAPASVELGSGVNANWSTCRECLLLNEDLNGANSAKVFFQSSGQLVLGAAPGAASMPLTFSSVRLVEVTIDDNEVSTPVPGGGCFDIVTDRLFKHGFD